MGSRISRRAFIGTALGTAGGLGLGGLGFGAWVASREPPDPLSRLTPTALEQLPAGKPFDICIIGSGPAGTTVALRLARHGMRVLLLESGLEPGAQGGGAHRSRLDRYGNSGALAYPTPATRLRAVGGTSNIWTGRCLRLLPADFASSPYARGTPGWPIDYAELAPYYVRAEETLNVRAGELSRYMGPREAPLPPIREPLITAVKRIVSGGYDITLDELLGPKGIVLDPVPESTGLVTTDRPVHFATDYLPELSERTNVTLVAGATVTALTTDDTGNVRSAAVRSPSGGEYTVSAQRFVIAGGTLETVRLLHGRTAQPSTTPRPPAERWLGHAFMEHPWWTYQARIPGLVPDHYEMRRSYQFVPRMHALGLGGIVFGFYMRAGRPETLEIALGIEMEPSRFNRIDIDTASRDHFGTPGVNTVLALSEADRRTLEAGKRTLHELVSKLGGEVVKQPTGISWSHHHMGGCRMGDDPATSVVDADLRVHGTRNLYAVTSGVFVTSGIANPTLTIVALAHRLADHLAAAGTEPASVSVTATT
ncbi:FAD-dependent oxidoreductase [Arhodomonas sp. AD133]|uniref:FAD-dependent oxidoreductase n=1 Tax=Arhodomonas sp. AD133 TaxID=3415009 RepID=UPI003EBF9B86